jgi:tetratricopeptide (TPR) repeat protein
MSDGSTESVELELIDESLDPPNDVASLSGSTLARPARMPTGTLAPPTSISEAGEGLNALRAQAQMHNAAQAWGDLSRTLRSIIDLGQRQNVLDEQERLDLYAHLGQLEEERLGRIDEAIDAWRGVLGIDPSDLPALTALERLFERTGRLEESLDVLEKRGLLLDDDDERRETLLKAAAAWEHQLGDRNRAAQLYQRVRASDPSNVVASSRLAAIYRHQHEWPTLVEILLERSELVDDVHQQIQLLHDVATVYERELGDQESAFYVLQAAFKRNYRHEQTRKELERLAAGGNLWQELLDEHTKRVSELEAEDPRAAADLWVQIGRWYKDHLSQREYAIHSMQQALRLDPAHADALASIASLLRQHGQWSELTRALTSQAAAEPSPDRKTELYIQLGHVLDRQAQDVDGAIEAYQQALVHDPVSPDALAALGRLYRDTQAWAQLADILSRRARLTLDDTALVHIQLEVGSILHLQLGDTAQAIAAYQKVVEVEPANLVALRALEALYEKTLQYEQYLAVLEAQLQVCAEDSERIALYERIAVTHEERFFELHRAAAAYEQIIAIDPSNYAAYHVLARLYQQAGNHEALVESHRRHIDATTDVAARVQLNIALGQAYATRLRDLDRAIEAYNDALSLDGNDAHALEALGDLYEQLGEWDQAVYMLGRAVEVCDDTRKHELFRRMGRIQHDGLDEPAAAEASLLRGLALVPDDVPTMETLAHQYSVRGEWLKAAQMMMRLETHMRVAVDKVRLLCEAANIQLYKLGAVDHAKQLYATAIALDPEHVETGRSLAGLYFEAGQWKELSPVIDMLCRKAGQLGADPKHLRELHYRAARCADELGDNHKALGYYKIASDLDSTHVPTQLGRADLLFRLQDWDNAGKAYETVILQCREGQREADLARVYNRLGTVRKTLGERKQALAMFAKALDIDPHHRETLLAVIELQTQLDDWEAVVRAKRGLVETLNEHEKPQVLEELGALYQSRLHNAPKAAAAYLEALELAPTTHRLVQKLLDLYIENKQWNNAIATIDRFIALEPDPFRKGLYFHAAATLCRDELKSLDDAVNYYDSALDSFFSEPAQLDEQTMSRAVRSFEAMDVVLTTKRDWKAQERAYRDMLKRLPPDDARFHKLRVGLLDGLGEIYRSRLKQYEEASRVFALAQQLDPDNALRQHATDRAEILAELYLVAGPDQADKAVDQHTRMLRQEPFKYDSYKALAHIYRATNQYDKYWCLCSTLSFLHKADADEHGFFEQFKPRGLIKARSAMTPASWAKLAHADENRYISAIFGACWQSVAAMHAFPHKDFGVKRGDRRQLDTDQLMFSKLFLYVAQALNVRLPDLYVMGENKAADIQLANAIDKSELCPSFVVRPHLLQGKTESEIAFLAARRLAFMRPEYYLRMLLPTNSALNVACLSAIVMVQPRFPVPPNMVATVQQYLPEMQKRMPPQAFEQLGVLVQRFIQATPEIDMAKWGHAVEATSHRAGFVMCGDLAVSASGAAAEPVVVGGPSVKQKVKELVLFSISSEYFAIRAQMGLIAAG